MLDQIEATVLSSLQMIFDQFGWAGAFASMAFENATGIRPSEMILAFAGWMLIERHGVAPSFIFVAGMYAGFGSAIGASITYWVARIGGRPVIDRFLKFFRIAPALVDEAENQMQEWGAGIVLSGRVIPGLRTLINIPAGIARIPFLKFFTAAFVGAYIWRTLLIGAGYVLGYEWKLISEYIKTHLPLVLSLGALAIGAYIAYHYRERIHAMTRRKFQPKLDNES